MEKTYQKQDQYKVFERHGKLFFALNSEQRTFWEKREQATRNISSERDIQLRVCRSIQVEGAFALLKNDFGFRRFLTRGKGNIRTELFFGSGV